MRDIRFALTLIALALFVVALAGCTASGSGTASIYVKDAPTDEFDEIHVVFTKVEVHRSGDGDGDDGNGTTSTVDGTGGWVTLYENATGQDVDLLDASGARAAFLGEADLEAGRYQQIRVHTTEAYGVQNGTRVDIQLSNGVLKLVKGFEVEADRETRIILDFDLDKSLKQTGQGWRMTPVVGKSSAEVVDDAESGAEAHDEGEVAEVA